MRKKTALKILEIERARFYTGSVDSELWLSEFSLMLMRIFPLSSAKKIRELKLFFEKNQQSFLPVTEKPEDFPVLKVYNFIETLIEEIEFAGTESVLRKLPLPFNYRNFWVITAFFLITGLVILSNVLIVKDNNEKIGRGAELYYQKGAECPGGIESFDI